MKTRLIYYSPCGSTSRIAEAVAAGLGCSDAAGVDLSVPDNRLICFESGAFETEVFAFPVYHGMLPELCLPYLKNLSRGGNVPAVLIVNGGGEGAGDALRNLAYLVTKAGYLVVAAGEFVSRHTAAPGLNAGRPNDFDIECAVELGRAAARRIASGREAADIAMSEPGAVPFWPSPVITVGECCTRCGRCARECVTGAINPNDVSETDTLRCAACMKCIENCPTGARTIAGEDWIKRMRLTQLLHKSGESAKIYT